MKQNSEEKKHILSTLNALYVEDELDLLEFTANSLGNFLNSVQTASNGQEGIDKFKEYFYDNNLPNFDVVITDINMPILNGLEMLEQIKEIDPTIAMVITTAHSDTEFLTHSIDLGVSGYAMKPLNIFQLFDSIIQAVEPQILRKQLEQKIHKQNVQIRSILDSQESLIIVNEKDKIIDCNKAFLDFTGFKSIDDVNEHIKCVSELFINDENFFTLKTINVQEHWLNLLSDSTTNNKRIVKLKNIKTNEYEIFQIIVNRTNDESIDEHVITLNNITNLYMQAKELEFQATHDFLTNIYNRQYLYNFLIEETKRANRYNNAFSMIMFDIDHFKSINDKYGHDVGDFVLISLTNVVSKYLRELDIFARYGGEEFMILLPETTGNEALQVANKIREKIEEEPMLQDKEKQNITCSFGVTQFIINEHYDDIIKRVDEALYEAKNNGRNQVVFK